MSNNSQQMKSELTSTLQKMIENNSVLRMKIIANKESKSSFTHSHSFLLAWMAFLLFLLGCMSIYGFISGEYAHIEKTLFNYFLFCVFPFLMAAFLYFFRNTLFVKIENIDQHVVRNFVDNKDYQLFYNAGSAEDKEILEFHKYLDTAIKYTEIGI